MRPSLAGAVAVVFGCAGLVPLTVTPALADVVLSVTTSADTVDPSDGVLSLREAVDQANAAPATPVDIVLATDGAYVLDLCGGPGDEDANMSGDIDVTGGLVTIEGNGSTLTNECQAQRVVHALPGADNAFSTAGLAVNHLTLRGGVAAHGITVLAARHLTLDHVTIPDASMQGPPDDFDDDGAVFHSGPTSATIVASTISGTTLGSGVVYLDDGTEVGTGTLTVADSMISGNATLGSGGGIVFSGAEPLRVDHSTISGNTAANVSGASNAAGGVVATGAGGGAGGEARIVDSTISANTLTSLTSMLGLAAGGIVTEDLTLQRSTVAGNTSAVIGGLGSLSGTITDAVVVDNDGGILGGGFVGNGTIRGSTFGGNTGSQMGGVAASFILDIERTTISGNAGLASGQGGVLGFGGASIVIRQSTVTDAIAASPGSAPSASYFVESSILGPCVPSLPPLTLTSGGNNFSIDASCSSVSPEAIGSAPGDIPAGGDPELAPLADNGGPTPTRLPLPNSPVRDRIVPQVFDFATFCWFSPVDQRGAPRPMGVGCDIGAVEAPVAASPGRGYHPVDPARVYDSATVGGGVPFGPGETRVVQVGGLGGVPATGVSAIAANVTVHDTDAASHLSVTAAGASVGITSNLNWLAGDTVANLVTTSVDGSGRVSIRNNSGQAHVLVDVAGWYDDGTDLGDALTTVEPVRILDTRDGTGGPVQPFGPGDQRELTVVGAGGLPAGTDAVVLNLTAVSPSATTHLTVWPSPAAMPSTSNLNLAAGVTGANLVIARVGADGKVLLRNNSGTTDVVADVFGYFHAGAGDRFHAINPLRIYDTRVGNPPWATESLGPNATRQLQLPPGIATAVLLNLTAVNPTADTHLSVRPGFNTEFPTSNVNVTAGHTRPNAALSGIDTSGRFEVHNNSGAVDVVVDLAGWYG